MATLSKRAAPGKPYPEFPLTPHPTGRWCKKVRGTIRYFGRIAGDPDGKQALDLWLKERDEWLADRTPDRSAGQRHSVKDACDAFLTTREDRAKAGEITWRHFRDLRDICLVIANGLGRSRPIDSLTPDDFGKLRAKLAERLSVVALKNAMVRVRGVFKSAFINGLVNRPVRYGDKFALPNVALLRRQRAEKGERLFAAGDLRKLIKQAAPQLRAMILLAVNCGLGNSDCGKLEFRHLDLRAAWLHFPRPKTGVDRKCKLWPETIKALKDAIADRPTPKDEAYADRVFLTHTGQPWADDRPNSPISQQFRTLLVGAGLYSEGLSFYRLRHQFETVAGGSRDQVAVDAIMGHADQSMASHYRERIEDNRLERVAAHVHAWLYQSPAKKTRINSDAPGQLTHEPHGPLTVVPVGKLRHVR